MLRKFKNTVIVRFLHCFCLLFQKGRLNKIEAFCNTLIHYPQHDLICIRILQCLWKSIWFIPYICPSCSYFFFFFHFLFLSTSKITVSSSHTQKTFWLSFCCCCCLHAHSKGEPPHTHTPPRKYPHICSPSLLPPALPLNL